MTNHDYSSLPIKCNECGRNQFKLTRMEKGQVLAECVHCGHAHSIDSIIDKKNRAPTLYWLSASNKIQRCIDCRTELKMWDVSYNGKIATSKCQKCGLTHTFKKPRFRDWQLISVTRKFDESLPNPKPESDLTKIKGIGPKRAIILNLAGITNITDLAKSSVFTLSSKTGISENLLERWIQQSKKQNF